MSLQLPVLKHHSQEHSKQHPSTLEEHTHSKEHPSTFKEHKLRNTLEEHARFNVRRSPVAARVEKRVIRTGRWEGGREQFFREFVGEGYLSKVVMLPQRGTPGMAQGRLCVVRRSHVWVYGLAGEPLAPKPSLLK